MALGKVIRLYFGVDDLEKTVEYFTKKLGFKLKSSAKRLGGESIELVSPAGDLIFEFNQITEEIREKESLRRPYVNHVCFAVDNLDKAYEELKSKGLRFSVAPLLVEQSGRKVAVAWDAEGREWIQLQEVKSK